MRYAVLLLAMLVLSGQQTVPPPPPPPPPGDSDVFPVDEMDFVDSDDIDPADLPVATDTLRARTAPPTVSRYRADPEFQYDTPQAKGPSLMERFWTWLARKVFGPIAANTTWGFWKVVLVALGVAILGWVIARLASAEGSGVFGRAKGGSVAGALLDVEDIATVDLGARLAAALDRGDLREAVRVRYLLVLQALDGSGVLAWRRDKTNRQYVTEVAASRAELAPPFRQVTRAFDAVWYGERPVPPSLYAELAPLFDRVSPVGGVSR